MPEDKPRPNRPAGEPALPSLAPKTAPDDDTKTFSLKMESWLSDLGTPPPQEAPPLGLDPAVPEPGAPAHRASLPSIVDEILPLPPRLSSPDLGTATPMPG